MLVHKRCDLRFLATSGHASSSKHKGVTPMKRVMLAAVNSVFKHTRERGATDVPGRGWERRNLVVYCRRRKYDEAQIKCCVDILVTDSISGRHKVLVVEAAWGAIVRRRIAGEEICFTLLGKTPTLGCHRA